MKNLICITLISLGLLSAHSAFAGDVANGEKLAATCAGCHGADGNSPMPMFPKIAGLGQKYLAKQLADIQNGDPDNDGRLVPEMAGILDGMSAQDLEDLAAYYDSKPLQLSGAKKAEVQVNSGLKVDSLTLGEKVYKAGNNETKVPACSGCHSPRGLGNAPAGFPRLGGQYAEYIEKQLKAFRAGDRRNDGQAMIMRGAAAHMSDAEISAVANYISGLN